MSKKHKQTASGNGKIEIAKCAFPPFIASHQSRQNTTVRTMRGLSCPAYDCKIDGLQHFPANCKRISRTESELSTYHLNLVITNSTWKSMDKLEARAEYITKILL